MSERDAMHAEWDELHDRLWARDPALAGACMDLYVKGKRRLDAQRSHLTAFFSCLDGIEGLNSIPGGCFDGNRDARSIRAIVEHLLRLAEFGVEWSCDSSLERWFPMTAERMKYLEGLEWCRVTDRLPTPMETIVFASQHPSEMPNAYGDYEPCYQWHLGWMTLNGTPQFYDNGRHVVVDNVVQWRSLGKMV